MKKKLMIVLLGMSALFLTSCGQKNVETTTETTQGVNNTIVYTLEYDHQQYQFNMLDGWRKFPNSDHSIAFLVGNKDQASFMSAGFEEKEKLSLSSYKDKYMERLKENDVTVTNDPELKKLNGMDAYYLGMDMLDEKDRVLTYRVYLIEGEDYFINLGAWTSEQNPSKEMIQGLDDILGTFKKK